MYKILKSMLAEFSYFIEKHFGISSILWSILFMAGCCAIVGVVLVKAAEIIVCCKHEKKVKKSVVKNGETVGEDDVTDGIVAASEVDVNNNSYSGDSGRCGKCKNSLSLFPVYIGFTVVCSYMMNRLIALSYTWDSKLQRVMSNFHYILSFKANRKLFLNALSLPDNTTNNNGLFQIAMYLNNKQWQKVYDNAGGSQWYFAKVKKAIDEILKVGDTHLTLGVIYQGAAMLIFGELLSVIVDSSLAKNKDLFNKRKRDLA